MSETYETVWRGLDKDVQAELRRIMFYGDPDQLELGITDERQPHRIELEIHATTTRRQKRCPR